MPHDELNVGQIPSADRLQRLDTQGTYTPTLTATTTNPNLGADGEADGVWHRNGHWITGWMRFLFSGTGLSAGSGAYEPTLPFDADLSVMTAGGSVGNPSMIGSGFLRDASITDNNRYVLVHLSTADRVRMPLGSSNSSVTDSNAFAAPFAQGDRISINFAYLADPAGLP